MPQRRCLSPEQVALFWVEPHPACWMVVKTSHMLAKAPSKLLACTSRSSRYTTQWPRGRLPAPSPSVSWTWLAHYRAQISCLWTATALARWWTLSLAGPPPPPWPASSQYASPGSWSSWNPWCSPGRHRCGLADRCPWWWLHSRLRSHISWMVAQFSVEGKEVDCIVEDPLAEIYRIFRLLAAMWRTPWRLVVMWRTPWITAFSSSSQRYPIGLRSRDYYAEIQWYLKKMKTPLLICSCRENIPHTSHTTAAACTVVDSKQDGPMHSCCLCQIWILPSANHFPLLSSWSFMLRCPLETLEQTQCSNSVYSAWLLDHASIISPLNPRLNRRWFKMMLLSKPSIHLVPLSPCSSPHLVQIRYYACFQVS